MNLLTINEYMGYYCHISHVEKISKQAITWRIRQGKELPGVIKAMKKGNQYLLEVAQEAYDHVQRGYHGYCV